MVFKYFSPLHYGTQSHYIEVLQGAIFYGTEYEIFANFGVVGHTEKNGSIMRNFLGRFFPDLKRYIVASALKSCMKCS